MSTLLSRLNRNPLTGWLAKRAGLPDFWNLLRKAGMVKCCFPTMLVTAAVLAASPALATEPCPPGSSVWHWRSIGLVVIYSLLALATVGLMTRAARKAGSGRKRWLLGGATLLMFLLGVAGGLALVMRIAWTGPCV